MDLHLYLRALRKNWWLILLCTLIGAGGGVLINYRATPMYESRVTFWVSTPTDAAGGNAYQANQYALAKIGSYIELMKSDALANRVIAETGVPLTTAQVSSRIAASSDLNTVLINVTVTDSSPERSLTIASAVAKAFGPLVDELDNRTSQEGEVGSTVQMTVTSGPTANPLPVSPRTRTNIALGIIVGFLIGVGLAIIRALLDTTVRSADALLTFTGLPALGSIPLESSTRKKSSILVGDQLRSVRAEAYRQIRTSLQFMDLENPVQVVVVASSVAGEGKSTTATNLAIVTAETGRRVLLIEADMRRPRVADYLGLERAVGLSNVLVGQVAVTDVLQPWGTDGLMVLPCGSIPPNPSELLGSHQMVDLIEDLRGMFDLIVMDTPPLLPVTDAAVASTRADGVICVVRYGSTSRNQIAGMLQSLDAVDARILGCVLSMVPRKGSDSVYDYYYEDGPKKKGTSSAARLLATPKPAMTPPGPDSPTAPGPDSRTAPVGDEQSPAPPPRHVDPADGDPQAVEHAGRNTPS